MKFTRNIFVLSVVILNLLSCSTKKENNLDTHKIIFLTSYYEDWLEKDKQLSPEESWNYGKNMLDKLITTYFSKCEYVDLFKMITSDTSESFSDKATFSKVIQIINSQQEIIRDKINTALDKCVKYLPYDGLNIFIVPFCSENPEKLGGVGGVTVGSSHIVVFIDPLVEKWEDQLETTIAHEFHHAYWTKFNFKSLRPFLLDRLIFEGKAEAFSHLLYPTIKQPWDSTLFEQEKKELWQKIKQNLYDTNFASQDNIMFGNNDYPLCCGYILGRDIVEAYLKKEPGMEPRYWTNFSPDFILKTSGYK